MSTILIVTTFVYPLVAASQIILEIRGPSQFITKIRGTLDHASCTANFARMLVILFIRTQVRALQSGPNHSGPQRRAQVRSLGCTAFVCVRTPLVIILPFLRGVR